MKKTVLSLLLISTLHVFSGASESEASFTIQKATKANVEFVDFIFSDLDGNLRNVTQPIDFLEHVLLYGTTFDGSSIASFSSINSSDLVLAPDIDTFTIVEGQAYGTSDSYMVCDICESDDTEFAASPRTALKRALERAHDMGYEFYVGPELEFFVFEDTVEINPCDQQLYFGPEKNVAMRAFRQDVLALLKRHDIPVEKLHHEVAPGQHEISIRYDNALKVADNILMAKHEIKTLANSYGLRATFMPKPIFGQNGSGMHIHFSLYDTLYDENAFAAPEDENHLSDTAKQFIAGVLSHVNEMALLLNPSINSYKRLVPGYEAPTNICWGTKNRSALIRIPYVPQDKLSGVRAEIRCPDPLCNPYLAFAAILHAGLDGIEQEMELIPAMNKNLYKLSGLELDELNIQTLPESLGHAIAYFAESDFMKDALGADLYSRLIELKLNELRAFETTVTDWELKRYQ